MTTNQFQIKLRTSKQRLITFSFLLTLILPFSAHSDGTTSIDPSFVYSELFAGTISILAAQNPKGTGHYMICCVATIGAVLGLVDLLDSAHNRQNEGKKSLITAGMLVAYGKWNISMDDDNRDGVFWNNFLLFNTAILFGYLKSRQASASETISSSDIQFVPTKNGGSLVYQHNF